jgi:hypothetical protein
MDALSALQYLVCLYGVRRTEYLIGVFLVRLNQKEQATIELGLDC